MLSVQARKQLSEGEAYSAGGEYMGSETPESTFIDGQASLVYLHFPPAASLIHSPSAHFKKKIKFKNL